MRQGGGFENFGEDDDENFFDLENERKTNAHTHGGPT